MQSPSQPQPDTGTVGPLSGQGPERRHLWSGWGERSHCGHERCCLPPLSWTADAAEELRTFCHWGPSLTIIKKQNKIKQHIQIKRFYSILLMQVHLKAKQIPPRLINILSIRYLKGHNMFWLQF